MSDVTEEIRSPAIGDVFELFKAYDALRLEGKLDYTAFDTVIAPLVTALKSYQPPDKELPTDPAELLKLADAHGWLYDDHSMGRALTNALRSLAAERDLVQLMLNTARKAYRELEPALADALSENDALRAKLARARGALPFFRSVIRSGEDWSDTCQRAYDGALED